MTKSDFLQYAVKNLKAHLPEDLADAEISDVAVKKNGEELHGIMIGKEDGIWPIIYMDAAFEEHSKGRSLYEILEEAAKTLERALGWDARKSMEPLLQYENAREEIFLSMCDPDMNREMLQTCPSMRVGELRAVFRANVPTVEGEQASMLITDDLMRAWDITYEELCQDALNNEIEKRPPQLWSLSDIASSPFSDPENLYESMADGEGAAFEEQQIYVLTNSNREFGASVLAREDVLKRVGEITGGDYIVLPSSIHEVIIVPASFEHQNGDDAALLEDMVKEVNESVVLPQERLSYKVQHYDAQKNVLENVRTWQERLSREAEQDMRQGKQMAVAEEKKPLWKPTADLSPKI